MTTQQLKQELDMFLREKPKTWRTGQAVFNYIDAKYGVARTVQFIYGIDCFYNDSNIEEFIEKSVELINE